MSTTQALQRFRPPNEMAGRLAMQSLLFALGEGTFMTGSAVFFTQIVGLSATQVGAGLSIAGVAAFLTALPAGRLVDRFGMRRSWALSAFSQVVLFALWPFVTGFGQYVALVVVMEVLGASLGGAAFTTYTLSALPAENRVKSRAYNYSALNLGFTLGSALGGVALAFNSDTVLLAVPWFTAALRLVNAFMIGRLPAVRADRRTAEERRVKPTGVGPMRNYGWLLTEFFVGVQWTNQVLLNVVIPLWLVKRTDAPHVVLAFMFGTNTMMCIFLPMVTSRRVKDVSTALRAIRISTVFFVVSCLITLATHHTLGWTTIALVWLGHVAVTGAELYLSPAGWTFEADLMDPDRRGGYQGASNLTGTLGKVWAPAAYTFLAMHWGAPGWLLIAGIVVLASIGLHPATGMAQRFLDRHGIVPNADVLADEDAQAEPTWAAEAPGPAPGV